MKMGHESNKPLMDIIPEKAQIPVIVNGSTYTPGSDAIVVSAVPFSPREFADSPIFFICESKASDNMERQSGMIADIELLNAEIKIHQKIKADTKNIELYKKYTFFSEQIYPYKQNLSTTAIANDIKFVPLMDVINLHNVELIYSMLDYHNLEEFGKIPTRSNKNTKTQDTKYTSIQIDIDSALKFIITERIFYLQALRGFVESYDLDQSNKLTGFWQLYKNAKLILE